MNFFRDSKTYLQIVQRFILITSHPVAKFLLEPFHSFIEMYMAVKPKQTDSYNWNKLPKGSNIKSDVIKLPKLSSTFVVSVRKQLKALIGYSTGSFDFFLTFSPAFWSQLWLQVALEGTKLKVVDFSPTCHFTSLIAGI
jgi:hypothetical protein